MIGAYVPTAAFILTLLSAFASIVISYTKTREQAEMLREKCAEMKERIEDIAQAMATDDSVNDFKKTYSTKIDKILDAVADMKQCCFENREKCWHRLENRCRERHG